MDNCYNSFRLSKYIPDSNEEFISLGNGSAIIVLDYQSIYQIQMRNLLV